LVLAGSAALFLFALLSVIWLQSKNNHHDQKSETSLQRKLSPGDAVAGGDDMDTLGWHRSPRLHPERDRSLLYRFTRQQFNFARRLLVASLSLSSESSESKISENIVLSPYGIYLALEMLANGADGATRFELATALGYASASSGEQQATALDKRVDKANVVARFVQDRLREIMQQQQGSGAAVEVHVGQAVFHGAGVAVSARYRTAIEQYFSRVGPMPLPSGAGAVDSINRWAHAETHGHVERLLASDAPLATGDNALMLLNAVYFRGAWARAFDASLGEVAPFYSARGDVASERATYLRSSEPRLYAQADSFVAVRLAYGAPSFEMIVALPKSAATPMRDVVADVVDMLLADAADAESTLTLAAAAAAATAVDGNKARGMRVSMGVGRLRSAKLAELALSASGIDQQQEHLLERYGGKLPPAPRWRRVAVDLRLPKVSARFGGDLRKPLEALGVRQPFDAAKARFDRMVAASGSGAAGLHVSAALHAAALDIDERGTEASAATLAALSRSIDGNDDAPIDFNANRPFLVLIRSTEPNVLLFSAIIESV
jgi:serine protease inhibitor